MPKVQFEEVSFDEIDYDFNGNMIFDDTRLSEGNHKALIYKFNGNTLGPSKSYHEMDVYDTNILKERDRLMYDTKEGERVVLDRVFSVPIKESSSKSGYCALLKI